jgi:hypothetical protein
VVADGALGAVRRVVHHPLAVDPERGGAAAVEVDRPLRAEAGQDLAELLTGGADGVAGAAVEGDEVERLSVAGEAGGGAGVAIVTVAAGEGARDITVHDDARVAGHGLVHPVLVAGEVFTLGAELGVVAAEDQGGVGGGVLVPGHAVADGEAARVIVFIGEEAPVDRGLRVDLAGEARGLLFPFIFSGGAQRDAAGAEVDLERPELHRAAGGAVEEPHPGVRGGPGVAGLCGGEQGAEGDEEADEQRTHGLKRSTTRRGPSGLRLPDAAGRVAG